MRIEISRGFKLRMQTYLYGIKFRVLLSSTMVVDNTSCVLLRSQLLFRNFNTLFFSTCSRLIVSSVSSESKEIVNEVRWLAC